MLHLDEDRLTALLDGELPDIEARQVREHLTECAECSARLDEVREFFAEANRLVQVLAFPQAPVPVAVPVAPAPKARKRFPLRQLAWAASVVMALGLGYYGNQLGRKQAASPSTSASAAQPAFTALRDTGHSMADKAAAPTNAAASIAAAPATPPAELRRQAAKGELDEKASKDQLASAKRADKPAPKPASAPAPVNEAPARDELARTPLGPQDAVTTKQALTNGFETATTGGASAANAQKTSEAKLADSGAARPRRGRAEAEGQSLMARSDLQKEMPAAPAASAGYRTAPVPAPVRIPMEQAVQALGGTIHLIDGMSPDRVEQLSARAVPGAHGGLPVIRVIYLDAPMREIWLDQQRGLGASAPRDTVMQWTPDGGQNMQWMTGTDDWLSLTAHLTADSLRVLARGVR